jgi:hypothetical protein
MAYARTLEEVHQLLLVSRHLPIYQPKLDDLIAL